jgi:MFS family permease
MPRKRYKQTAPWVSSSKIIYSGQPTTIPDNVAGVQPAPRPELHAKEGGVITPFLQAIITGILLGIAAGVLAWLTSSPVPWRWGFGICAITWAVSWFLLLMHNIGLTEVKPWFGMGGEDDDPPAPVQPMIVNHYDEDKQLREVDKFDLPGSPDQLRTYAAGILDGISPAQNNWVPLAKGFSRDGYEALIDELLKRHL